jgi:TRAP transporter TAXI family solute receptor
MNKRRVAIVIPLVVILAAVVAVWHFAEPATPKKVELLAGPQGTNYYKYARRYADFLGEKGITANIVETASSLENLRRLAAEETPAAAFALSGAERALQPHESLGDLVSLGSLSYEPLWLFVRSNSEITRIDELAGKKVALGPPESDVRTMATRLVGANGVEDQIVEAQSPGDSDEVAAALINGELDAVFVVGSPKTSHVSLLLASDGVKPVALERVATYTSLQPEAAAVVLPEGAFDLAKNIPETDLQLLAIADNLVVRSDLHPAVVDLLLDAARNVHREPTLFTSRDTFPNMQHTSLPLSPAAINFYENGPSPLRKYLPFWLASLISRFALIVAQVGAVVWILLKMPPTLLRLRFSLKRMRLYRQMEKLEERLEQGADPEHLMADLRGIRDQSAAIHPPLAELSQYLELRQNIHDQRERIQSRGDWQDDEASDA